MKGKWTNINYQKLKERQATLWKVNIEEKKGEEFCLIDQCNVSKDTDVQLCQQNNIT